MTRTPADVINAILKNLEYAASAEACSGDRHRKLSNHTNAACCESASEAYEAAIALIRTEAKDLLPEGAKP